MDHVLFPTTLVLVNNLHRHFVARFAINGKLNLGKVARAQLIAQ